MTDCINVQIMNSNKLLKCYIIQTVNVPDVIRSNIIMTFLTANIDGMTIISSYVDFICHLTLLLAYRIPHQLPAPGL